MVNLELLWLVVRVPEGEVENAIVRKRVAIGPLGGVAIQLHFVDALSDAGSNELVRLMRRVHAAVFVVKVDFSDLCKALG